MEPQKGCRQVREGTGRISYVTPAVMVMTQQVLGHPHHGPIRVATSKCRRCADLGLVGWNWFGMVGLPDICATVEDLDRYDRGGHDLSSRLALGGSCCSMSLVLMDGDLQTSPCQALHDIVVGRRNAAGERSSETPLSVGPPAAAASSSCSLQRHGSLAGPSPRGLRRLFVGAFHLSLCCGCQRARGARLNFRTRGATRGSSSCLLAIRNLKREATQLHCHCSPRLSLHSPPSYE